MQDQVRIRSSNRFQTLNPPPRQNSIPECALASDSKPWIRHGLRFQTLKPPRPQIPNPEATPPSDFKPWMCPGLKFLTCIPPCLRFQTLDPPFVRYTIIDHAQPAVAFVHSYHYCASSGDGGEPRIRALWVTKVGCKWVAKTWLEVGRKNITEGGSQKDSSTPLLYQA